MQRFRNILFVCDEQSAFELALERVIWLASANGARVTMTTTIDSGGAQDVSSLFSMIPALGSEEIAETVIAVNRAKLNDRAQPLRDRGIPVETKLRVGTPFIEIIRKVLRGGHDIVIKGAHRTAGRRFYPGADMHLLRKCPCPFWVLNSAAEPRSRQILVAIDPDATDTNPNSLNRTIMELATSLARNTLIMGTFTGTGVAVLFIGDTAETILNHVSCSVLTAKVTPIGAAPAGGIN